jgi:secondary thiamine-phosphate synthase enzyme
MIELKIPTNGRGLIEITSLINENIKSENGLCNIFCKHTSASVVITGNEDPDLLLDIDDFLKNFIKDGNHYRHNNEGDFDTSGHIRTLILGDSKTIPIKNQKLNIGKFQGVFLYEHRGGENIRSVVLSEF